MKTLFAFAPGAPDCSDSRDALVSFDDGGGVFRVGDDFPLQDIEYTHEREVHGTRLIETWRGPAFRGLSIGCVSQTAAIGAPGVYVIDELAEIRLR